MHTTVLILATFFSFSFFLGVGGVRNLNYKIIIGGLRLTIECSFPAFGNQERYLHGPLPATIKQRAYLF